jgi:uncharacterized Zn finger protein (UPF0148 family)
MNNRDILKKGADYLLKGGTLLSESCQTCNGLLIKFKGDIMCLNCQSQNLNNHELEKEQQSSPLSQSPSDKIHQLDKRELIQTSPEKDNSGKVHSIKENENYQNLLSQIEKTIIKRATDIDRSIYNENDSNKQTDNLKILLLYLKVLKRIRK